MQLVKALKGIYITTTLVVRLCILGGLHLTNILAALQLVILGITIRN
jgi:hypothetical protein